MTSAPPPHRIQIPNIVDDLGLDPYERALYVHYKRVCGENQGAYCYEAVKTTAHKVKMSTGQVSEARRTLTHRGLILVQDNRPVVVTVVNLWEMNTAFYQLEHRPDVDGWNVEQVKLWLHDMSTDVHTVNVSSHNDIDTRSPDETILTVDDLRSPSETSLTDNDNMSSYVHTVKQRSKESLIESKRESTTKPNETGPLTLSLAKVCLINLEAATKRQRNNISEVLSILVRVNAVAEQVLEFGDWWKLNWRGKNGSPPLPSQVCDLWGEYQDWVSSGKNINGKEPKVRITAF